MKIVAVHQEDNFSEVLVKNFPVTDRGKIKWWLDNQKLLKTKYDIPKTSSYGDFYINFWDFGDGYKEPGKYDRRCFVDMKTERKCIDKKAIFSVENNRGNGMLFTFIIEPVPGELPETVQDGLIRTEQTLATNPARW